MLKDKRILFYVPGLDVINGAVYYSQVFGLAKYLVSQGAECMVVESAYDEKEYSEKTVDGITIVSCPNISRYVPLPFLPYKNRAIVRPALAKAIEFAPTHIYVRNVYAGLAALPLARKCHAKLVFSRRGYEIAEAGAAGTFEAKLKMWIERFYTCLLMRRSAHVSMVASTLIKDTEKFNRNYSVLPCCVMDDKFEVVSEEIKAKCRDELSIPATAKVVVYSGSYAHYQIPEVLVDLMKRVVDVDSSIVFLILSIHIDEFETLLKNAKFPAECYRLRSCVPQAVRQYLQCADVGIILRKNDDINRHASPVKLPEYMASGLGLIASPWIGDAGNWLKDEKGVLLYDGKMNVNPVVSYVNGVRNEEKLSNKECARRHYTYSGNKVEIEKMFA